MDELGMNGEWAAMQMRAEYLRGRCAEVLEEYMHLINCVGPNLKSAYMMAIGQYEHQVYQLKLEIGRWQRRFTLRQQALNRGEKPDVLAIEAVLDEEFKAYLEQVKQHQQALKDAAKNMSMGKMSESETNAIRVNYLNAVKKLHPDINPNLPPSAKELWLKVQKAYQDQNWRDLDFLVGMVDAVVGGRKVIEPVDGFHVLADEVARLEKQLKDVGEKLAATRKEQPYCWEEFLDNEDEVKLRQVTLANEIDALQEAVREYEQIWNGKEAA